MLSNIQDVCEKVLTLETKKPIRIYSHNDADGITSTSIIARMLKELGIHYWASNIKRFDYEQLEIVNADSKKFDASFILDFGLDRTKIKTLAGTNRKFFILDHHIIEDELKKELVNNKYENIHIVNPHLNDEENISGAGISYLFSREILGRIEKKYIDNAYIAIIGMLGDIQNLNEVIKSKIVEDAVTSGKVQVRRGLNIFGTTRPIQKALEFSGILPESDRNASEVVIELLRQAEISLKDNGRYRTLLDLSHEEISRLTTIILARTGRKERDIIGNFYLIKFNSHLYDARELATIVNACGRMGKSSIGIEACYGNLEGSEKIYREYRKTLTISLQWATELIGKIKGPQESEYTENTEKTIFDNNSYLIINTQENVDSTILGALVSMLSVSYPEKILVGLAYDGNKIKVSARAREVNINLKFLLQEICEQLEGAESGGHEKAAGCLLSREHENLFIDYLEKNLCSIKV